MRERKREEADKKKKRITAVGKLFCVIFLPFTKEVYSIAQKEETYFSSLLNL